MISSSLNWIFSNLVTIISCLIIVILFFCYCRNLYKISKFNKKLKNISKKSDLLTNISSTPELTRLAKSYKETIVFPNENEISKTDEPSNVYFNISSAFSSLKINQRAMSAASGMLVGLGLLGTFLGLTLGVNNFDSSSTAAIQFSINSLLGGMGTAFFTSLFGMGLSSLYIILEKWIVNKFNRTLELICDKLDDEYYISQPEKYALINERQITLFKKQNEQMFSLLKTTDSNGNEASLANIVRGIYEENEKQSRALSNFTEELFFKVTNDAMNESLTPLVREVKNVTETLSEKLDNFAAAIKSPSDNMAEGIVTDLKTAIGEMLAEFKRNVAALTTGKMDDLNEQLKIAVTALASFPEQMNTMTITMANNFNSINDLIQKFASDSNSLNESTMNKMKEQIDNTTQKMTQLAAYVEESIMKMNEKTIATNDAITDRQTASNQQSNVMVEAFNKSIKNTENLLININSTLEQFRKLQTEATATTLNMSNLSATANQSALTLKNAQESFISGLKSRTEEAENVISKMTIIIDDSQSLSKETATRFSEIRNSLSIIFTELNKGLNQYSETVKINTQQLLDSYSKSTSEAIKQLAGAVEQLGDVLEDTKDTNKNSQFRR